MNNVLAMRKEWVEKHMEKMRKGKVTNAKMKLTPSVRKWHINQQVKVVLTPLLF